MSILRSLCAGSRFGLTSRLQVCGTPLNQIRCVSLQATPVRPIEKLPHDEKNANLSRPLSPHLTIYKPQLTSMMSISHRMTGLVLTSYAFALAGASFLSKDIPQLVAAIQDLHIPGFIVFLAKLILAFPAAYHLCNGIRHLVWDMGFALTIKEVYLTGYITIALSVLFALYLATR